jgi:hypothetical protein
VWVMWRQYDKSATASMVFHGGLVRGAIICTSLNPMKPVRTFVGLNRLTNVTPN